VAEQGMGVAAESVYLRSLLADAQARAGAMESGPLTGEHLLLAPAEAYLTGTYPPLKAMGHISEAEAVQGATRELSLYIHVPFCQQRCTFCHFAKEIRAGQPRVTSYLDALMREFCLAREKIPALGRVASVYVGGGTPSLLEPRELANLFASLWHNFPSDDQTEVTFELHPQVVRDLPLLRKKFRVLADSGVNRIAFGAQTLDDRILSTLNRGHTGDDVLALIDFLHEASFENFSVDLIYGLPYETVDGWFSTLETLLRRGVSKLNIFPLFFKVTDPVSRLFERNARVFPGASRRLITHILTESYLFEHGFHRGPVLYYSREEHHSRQQESKFDAIEAVNLLGLGVSSFGYLGGTQYYNHCSIDDYIGAVNRGVLPVWRGVTLNDDEQARRAVMFGLRSAGVRRHAFRARFGVFPEDKFPQLLRFHDLGLLARPGDVWRVTDTGAYCVDGMASRLASDAVRGRIDMANRGLGDRRRSSVEQYDFSPLGRTGASVPRPRASTRSG
jgi:oxygen-independent coproporphyrinogen-3 oxidase